MKTTDPVKHSVFQPSPLADDWSKWMQGTWEGAGESQAGRGSGVEEIELAMNGQFLICRGEATIAEMTPDQVAYLKTNMHASDEEIERFRTLPYRSLEIFTIDPTSGDVLGFSFDSLRCIATGRGRREANRQTINWEWTNGHKSTRVTERAGNDRMVVTQLTPMSDGSVMEETGEATRRIRSGAAPTSPVTPESAAVKAFIAAINSQDFAALAALMSEDHTLVDSGGTAISGRESTLVAWRQYFAMFPDYRVRADSVLQSGSLVAIFGTWSGTYAVKAGLIPENAATGPAAWSAWVEDARIKRWQVFVDHEKTAEVMKRNAE